MSEITSKPATDAYRENFERIFRGKVDPADLPRSAAARLQSVQEFLDAGLIGPRDARRLLGDPIPFTRWEIDCALVAETKALRPRHGAALMAWSKSTKQRRAMVRRNEARRPLRVSLRPMTDTEIARMLADTVYEPHWLLALADKHLREKSPPVR